jgi:hypothetical protein
MPSIWDKVKTFVSKYWQWLVLSFTAIAFYLLGRSRDTKKQEVEFHKKAAELERERIKKVVEGFKGAVDKKDAAQLLNEKKFEERKKEIEKKVQDISIKEYLESKGIKRE